MIDNQKLEELAALITAQEKARLLAGGYPYEQLKANHGARIKPGIKYTKIDVGTSGKYMIDNETSEIFGIKAYGVIHRGHRYGTLDTIHEYFWGDYRAVRLDHELVGYCNDPLPQSTAH